MQKESRYLLKNIGLMTISNFSSKILVFLLVPLYTSVLTTEEYGSYDLVVSIAALLVPILTLNISDAIVRFCMDKNEDKNVVATIGVKYSLIGIFLFGIGIVCVYFAKIDVINLYFKEIIFYYVSYVLYQYALQFAKGIEEVKHMAIAGIISTVALIVFNVLFLLVFNFGLNGFYYSNILAQFIPFVYLFIILRIWKYLSIKNSSRNLEKRMLLYSVPLITTTVGWWINSAADRYIVVLFCGVAANGLLSIAYKIPSIITSVQLIFTQSWQISAVKEYNSSTTYDFYTRIFSFLNLIVVFVCSILIILSKPLAKILYSNDFYEAWQYVPFLLVSIVFNSASGFLGPILAAKKDSKNMAISSVIGAIINIGLNFLLIWLLGIQGATIATVVSSFVIFLIRRFVTKNDFKINNKLIVYLSWLLLVLQCVIEIYTKLWYFEILIIFVFIVLYWKQIIEVFKFVIKLFKKKESNPNDK